MLHHKEYQAQIVRMNLLEKSGKKRPYKEYESNHVDRLSSVKHNHVLPMLFINRLFF
jgi:hypothetical protein